MPWFTGGHLDPWDHIEALMGLVIGGEYARAQRGFRWLAHTQLQDGSWWARYTFDEQGRTLATEERRETNYVAYVATGLWHYFRVTGDRTFTAELFPVVEKAIAFVLDLQRPEGDIDWAVDARGSAQADALRTGCSSIYKSLECACLLARELDQPWAPWWSARARLGEALREKPERFDRTWESKARFSMDWFYPVLAGVFPPEQGARLLASRWQAFVEPGLGCRCVVEEPWVTVAESCELVLALLATGERERAGQLLAWLYQWQDQDGAWWTGYQFVEDLLWPDEKPTWTAGAVLLALDAWFGHTKAADLFTSVADMA
jgi:GH15 family glucan-1,4-alpha-glucosidase